VGNPPAQGLSDAGLVLITSRAVALVCSIYMQGRSSFRGTAWQPHVWQPLYPAAGPVTNCRYPSHYYRAGGYGSGYLMYGYQP